MLSEMITKRRSFRLYENREVETEILEKILHFCKETTPLEKNIKIKFEMMKNEDITCPLTWLPPQSLALFSEKKNGYLENAGFILQQVDLFIQSLGLGTCWVGKAKPKFMSDRTDDLDFVIILSFGYFTDSDFRRGAEDFNRKNMDEISDFLDPRLEAARLAPSSINSQPWFFSRQKNSVYVYQTETLLIPVLEYFNPIDMGIVLAHLFVTNPQTFRFQREETAPEKPGFKCIGSFTF